VAYLKVFSRHLGGKTGNSQKHITNISFTEIRSGHIEIKV